jgi:hypothetical protein
MYKYMFVHITLGGGLNTGGGGGDGAALSIYLVLDTKIKISANIPRTHGCNSIIM